MFAPRFYFIDANRDPDRVHAGGPQRGPPRLPRRRVRLILDDPAEVLIRTRNMIEVRLLHLQAMRLNEQLSITNEALEAFNYTVAHDLHAPLRAVLGFVGLLQSEAGPTLSETSRGHLARVSRATTRMETLIDDLLAFSRSGQSELQKTEVDLDRLVEETLIDLKADASGRRITWHINSLPRVGADRALLHMVLVNLISNAVKFTSGRAEATIEIGASSDNGEAVIFVRDNGAGFDPRRSSRLFAVFQRLHSSAQFEGMGIGLANVQRIIHRHGGRTWAEGALDQGATFYFSPPPARGRSEAQGAEPSRDQASDTLDA
jgi:light-regulated signal transduction histidine kinase (bacteriophytochrome)